MRSAPLPRSMFTTRKPPRAARPAWKACEQYLRWLRKLPCAFCRAEGTPTNPIVAAHVDHAGQGTPMGKGMGTKVADRHGIPLCDECHRRQHRIGWKTFEIGLPLQSAPALSDTYWAEWPGRRAWEHEQAAADALARVAP